MGVVNRCGHCRSLEIYGCLDAYQCWTCGHLTDMYGRPVPPEPQFSVPHGRGPWRTGAPVEGAEEA